MGFSNKIKEDLMVAAARHCCVCHRYRGVKLEIHHILPREQGGEDTAENGIVLCFDCHSDAGHYFANHPKGTKFSPSELRKHKEEWFQSVKLNHIQIPNLEIEVVLEDSSSHHFEPVFIEQITKFESVDKLRKVNMEEFMKLISVNGDMFTKIILKKVKTFDDFVSYMNGDMYRQYKRIDLDKERNPQPIRFDFEMTGNTYSYRNLSTCLLRLKINNDSDEVLENYKLYLKFNNIVKAAIADKRLEFFDTQDYIYNTTFKSDFEGEFIPSYPILVQNDSVSIDPICFKPKHTAQTVFVDWRIVARNYSKSGRLEIFVNPKIEQEERTRYVETPGEPIAGDIKSKFEF